MLREFVLASLGLWSIAGCAGTHEVSPPRPLSIRVGMSWAEADRALKESGARPFMCGYGLGFPVEFLFDAPPKYKKELEKGIIPDELRTKFRESGSPLSADVRLEQGGGRSWGLIDNRNRRRYSIGLVNQYKIGLVHQDEGDVLKVFHQPPPFRSSCCRTLSNGMSVDILTEKQWLDEEPTVIGLAVCNSTMLFCCKGESWYAVESINIAGHRAQLKRFVEKRKETPREHAGPVLIHKGMTARDVAKAVAAARVQPLRTDGDWLDGFPNGGGWAGYDLGNEVALMINMGNPAGGDEPVVRLMVVEATKPASTERAAQRLRIEFELLDLKSPLKDEWYAGFHQRWAWDPKDPERTRRLSAIGHLR